MGRRRFLEGAARELAGPCPAQARFLLWTLNNTEGKKRGNVDQVCCYCFQFLQPGNYRVRLMPKMKVTPQIEKLLNREKKNYKLNLKQTKLLKKYKESRNALLITCNMCRKTARHNGKSREDLGMKTPTLKTFSNQTPPVSHSHSAKPSSGSRTSTSGTSTPSSSSRTPKNAKSHFTQLKRLLVLEENKKNDKGDLKNFLLSL
ncbi:UPF0711 protein C18orf21 homolog [Elgaria multicarinata webbii]|uniref:UPF0711 protein C18orf21 homolog n=1 Tax=Elgaria multicarinata webbii TaxID=159646 RepID=UPI002FCD4ADE